MKMNYKLTFPISGLGFLTWVYAFLLCLLVSDCKGGEEVDGGYAQNSTLQLTIQGDNVLSRATGSSLPDTESTVHNLVVGLFYTDGSVNTIVEPTLNSGSGGTLNTGSILCSPGSCDVLVVANVPESTFAGVRTKNEFIGKTLSLTSTANEGVQSSDNLPMSGISDSSVSLEAGGSVSATVHLSRLVARISISSIRTAFSLDNAHATFTLDRIFLCNALESSKVAPGVVSETMPDSPTWLNGGMTEEQPDGSYLWISGTGFLLNDVTPEGGVQITSDAYTVPYWFYAFANNNTTYRTKLVLSGYFDQDGPDGASPAVYVYYPIVVNQAQAGTIITPSDVSLTDHVGDGTLVRNCDYRIKAVIKGDGESNPGSEIHPSNLDLTVEVDDWTLQIVQEVELN
ncbi:MAG: fimbrial protein [Bacteroides sp.]|nr:fimbrial protein [Bacteroides sp.]